MIPQPLAAVLARQDGVVTIAQVAACGVPDRTLRRWASEHGWRRVAPRVFLAAGHPWTDRARVRAAGLWAGGRGAVSGPAAAWWHGMPARVPAEIQVTMPRCAGLQPAAGIRLRRRDIDAADLGLVDGILVTAPPVTALETAATVPQGSSFLDRALQKHVGFDEVYAAYCRNLGAHGSRRTAELLVAAADRADSAAERRLMRLLRRAGVRGWVRGHPFGPWTIDLAFPAARLAVEVDGWAWHAGVDRFQADRAKGNALVGAGWVLLRFTWHDLNDRPDAVIRAILGVLRAAA